MEQADVFGLLRAVRVGLVLSILSMLFGFGMGIAFGAFEDQMKGYLTRSAEEVVETVYKNDAMAMKAVVDKSWTYYKRAHLHAGVLGTNALALCLLMGFLTRTPGVVRALGGAMLGGGSLAYGIYWFLAGSLAPGMGSTDAAKESLVLLAQSSTLSIVGATVAVLVMLAIQMWRR